MPTEFHPNLIDSSSPKKLSQNDPELDVGYSHDSGDVEGLKCINPGAMVQAGSNVGMIDFERQYNLTQVKQQFDFTEDDHVTLGLFTNDDAVTFVHYMENDALDETLIYRTNFVFKESTDPMPEKINGDYLNPIGEVHWKNNPADFRQFCGDSYIQGIHHGADLYIALQFHFNKEIDKQTFDAKYSSDFANLATFTKEIESTLTQINSKGNMHVMAYQVGGDPTQLSKLFGNGPSPTIAPSSVTQCSFDDLASCTQLLNNALNYISSDFPSQLRLPPDGSIPALAAQTGFESEPYIALNPAIKTNSALTPEIIAERDKLGIKLEAEEDHLQRAEFLVTMYTNPAYHTFVDALKAYIPLREDDISKLQAAGQNCFSNLSGCVTEGEKTLSQLHSDDVTTLTIPAGYYFQRTATKDNGLGSDCVHQIYVDSNNTIYLATRNFCGLPYSPTTGGLSISTNGGSSFTTHTIANGLGSNEVTSITKSGSTLYVGTRITVMLKGGGLSISTDGGQTFINKTTLNGLGSNDVNGVYVNADNVYVATACTNTNADQISCDSSDGGLSISTDGGNSFTNRTTANGLGSNWVNGVYVNGNTVYASTSKGLSISIDGGQTFTNKTRANGLGSNLIHDVAFDGKILYVAAGCDTWNANHQQCVSGGGLSISTDGGQTFTNKTTANGLGSNDVISVSVENGIVAVGTNITYPANYLDGGISLSYDDGQTFVNKTLADGLGDMDVYATFLKNGIVYAGTYHYKGINSGVSISSSQPFNGGMSNNKQKN